MTMSKKSWSNTHSFFVYDLQEDVVCNMSLILYAVSVLVCTLFVGGYKNEAAAYDWHSDISITSGGTRLSKLYQPIW